MNSTSNYSISLLSFQLAVCCIRVVVVVDGRSHFRYVRQIIIIQLCRATTWHKNEKCLSVDTCSRFPYRGEKKRKKKKQRRLRQPYWPRQQSLITGCRGLYCSDEHEIRPEMRSPRLYSDDRVIMIIDVTDGSIFCTICVFNRFFSSFFQPSHFVASGLDFEVSGALHLSSTQVEGNQRPLAFNTQQLCSVLSPPSIANFLKGRMAFHHLVELRNRNGSRVSAARASYFVTGGWEQTPLII